MYAPAILLAYVSLYIVCWPVTSFANDEESDAHEEHASVDRPTSQPCQTSDPLDNRPTETPTHQLTYDPQSENQVLLQSVTVPSRRP